ncbi:acetate--CoA ligase family protein [Catelliglobosispora koreensis]|uniref:acetate--CoA ligase family protein n=1 Tax=Catelliglobosispora koreensis TaxID=129052 RepID=UPI00036DB4C4|nr:acetate--CoA ligase [Catelliglobosispora koreensis]
MSERDQAARVQATVQERNHHGPATVVAGNDGRRDLSALFDPRSVAIVGASDDPAKWGNAVATQALRASRRPVHLVNRRGGTILGQTAATCVTEIGEPVDLVVITVPAATFESAVDDALTAGAKAIVGITAGFAETGDDGAVRQAAIVKRVRDAGAVLVGPNCLGLVDNTTEVYLSSDQFSPGGVALLSQSGNLALEFELRLRKHGLGFSRFVSFGNQADVTLVDLVADCAAHPLTTAIAVYAEDFGNGREFASVCAASAKPVLLLTAGAGEASARGAKSHTGALTTSADVVAAAARDAGVHLVQTPRELAAKLAALSAPRRSAGRRTVVLTDGGGHGSIAADVAERAGLEVPLTGPDLQHDLRGLLWGPSAVGNPVDLAGMGEQDPMSYAHTVGALLTAPEVDAVLMTGFFGGYSGSSYSGGSLGDGELAAAKEMARLITASPKPVAVQSMYPDSPSCKTLTEAGVPVFEAIEDAAAALRCVTGITNPAGIAPLPEQAEPVTDKDYYACRELLKGLAFPPAIRVSTVDREPDFAGPYVLKALNLLHKSDAGGVALNLATFADLKSTFDAMDERLSAGTYSVEQMADLSQGIELIVGVRWDERFGPVAMIGLGGVHTEVLRDVVFALAPVTAAHAITLLRSLKTARLLDGFRGSPAVDVAAAAKAIETITTVSASHPELAELEVNPLLVSAHGAVALDARAV